MSELSDSAQAILDSFNTYMQNEPSAKRCAEASVVLVYCTHLLSECSNDPKEFMDTFIKAVNQVTIAFQPDSTRADSHNGTTCADCDAR